MTSRNLDAEMGVQQERRPNTWYDVSFSPVTTEQPQTKSLWRLDSDVEVDLDRIPMRIPSPELDLSVRCLLYTSDAADE